MSRCAGPWLSPAAESQFIFRVREGDVFVLEGVGETCYINGGSMDDYSAYIPVGEPDGEGRLQAWQTAIGLQAVDGLHPSAYLLKTAKRNIAGDISIDEARRLIHDY